MLAEPFTTLTDYAIAVECWGLALVMGWHHRRCRWAIAFAWVGVAAALGGTLHGFPTVVGQPELWVAMLLALALASASVVMASVTAYPRWQRRTGYLLALIKLGLVVGAIRHWGLFELSVVDYLTALAIATWLQRPRSPWLPWGLLLAAIAIGMLGLPAIVSLRMSPLGMYHLVQMGALYCIYRGAR